MKRIANNLSGTMLLISVMFVNHSASAADAVPDVDKETPSATIELSGGSIGAGIGFSWGSGTVYYQGQAYPVSVSGLSVGSIGATSLKATGAVYNLKKIGDLNDLFHVFAAGAAVGSGEGHVLLGNTKGVEIRLDTENHGLKLNGSSGGLQLKVADTPRSSDKSP